MNAVCFFVIFCCRFSIIIGGNQDKRQNVNKPDTPILRIKWGRIQGITVKSHKGFWYHSYRGIPYGTPPTSVGRFKAPQPHRGYWDELRMMDKYRLPCLGLDKTVFVDNEKGERIYNVTGSEDCLYLNVHLRETQQFPQPVIFYLHDGGFFSGSVESNEATYLMDNPDVIFVNPAYRVGPLGFAYTGDSTIKGNMGLKDQILALQWVKTYIGVFGGDPNKILITGLGAGAASVHFMYFSHLSDGLFTMGYSMSGTAVSPWALTTETTLVERTMTMIKKMKCHSTDRTQMLSCLHSKSANAIVLSQQSMLGCGFNPFSLFTPFIDTGHKDGYFKDDPSLMMKLGTFQRIPWMTGYTADNGVNILAETFGNENKTKFLKENWAKCLPNILFYNSYCCSDLSIKLLHYRDTFGQYVFLRFLELITDRNYVRPAIQSIRAMGYFLNVSVYLYTDSILCGVSTSQLYGNHLPPKFKGTAHGDDTLFMLKRPELPLPNEPYYQTYISKFTNILVSLAFTQEPPTQMLWDRFNFIGYQIFEFYAGDNHEFLQERRRIKRAEKINVHDNDFDFPRCLV